MDVSHNHFAEKLIAYFQQKLKQYFQKSYQAFKDGLDFQEKFMENKYIQLAEKKRVAKEILEAYQYYFEKVQQADWGNVYVLKFKYRLRNCYVIYVTTDGDDGWVELYAANGENLGTARRYLELLGWEDVQSIRNYVETSAFPKSLENRANDTLWGK